MDAAFKRNDRTHSRFPPEINCKGNFFVATRPYLSISPMELAVLLERSILLPEGGGRVSPGRFKLNVSPPRNDLDLDGC